jgi:outer membrane protein assembly factor BamE
MRTLVVLAIALALAGCVHKIDVQQGNYVTQDLVDRLKVGMTKAEVRQLLGTPLLSDVFHANQWDYYFSNLRGRKADDRTRLSIFFENDRVVRFAGNARPPDQRPVSEPSDPRAQRAPK